jgi:dienelactone hydrolase
MTKAFGLLLSFAVLLAVGCQSAAPEANPAPTQTAAPTATATLSPSPTASPTPSATATPTATPTATATATATPTATPTPDPYAGLTIEDLRARAYGGGELAIVEPLASTGAFVRSLVTYPSDGLTIYGFMNVPTGEGPFPVSIVLHGYIEPSVYDTLAYTTRYADALARAGYVVLHPNLRGYPPSDSGPNTFRVGMAVDVLNLLALIRAQAGQPGPLEKADASAIALMGHSMGGGITWRVLTVDTGVGAAVLYGSMHADELENRNWRLRRSGGGGIGPEGNTPEADLLRISPASYLADIVAPVSIHHSIHDETVPYEWSEALAARMEELDKPVELFLYSNTPHTFRGEADQLFMQRMIAFFGAHLRAAREE